MRGLVSVMLVLIFISLFIFVALSVNREYNDFKESSKGFEFKTFTSAVCEDKSDKIYCKDELFVACNGKISRADEIKECNGFKIDNKVTGFAAFGKD